MKLGKSTISYNNHYMTMDGQAWFPVMGEIHFSRYPRQYWEESLLKMKAGGVQLAATYVFWIHHEEIEGVWESDGQKDLREFLRLCKKVEMPLILRIGPWAHGECRNGGFPDWLLKKGFKTRSNDAEYLEYVKGFYEKVFAMAEGFLWKDNGPVVGIQIENEFGHAGGLRGEEGEEHMRRLTALAKEVGFDVPVYTATGWGGAVTGGLLPVMGGYCDAPWARSTDRLAPSGNYIFTKERNDGNIGSDFKVGDNVTFDYDKFPFLTAELGGGLQVTHHRRPAAHGKDIGAMSLVKLGSGVNLLGYYMYHGGTNPKGRLTTLQESLASGGYNDLPELNYDFRAPIREYGQISDTYKEIKLLAMFVKDFGSELCGMDAVIPEDNPLKPGDFEHIRYAYRLKGDSGYVFINNFQRLYDMKKHDKAGFKIQTANETVTIPPRSFANGEFAFYPFNFRLNDNAVLKTALATPLCRLNSDVYVFYGDLEPEYRVEGALGSTRLITLTREDALNAYKISSFSDGAERLVIYDGYVLEGHGGLELIGRNDCEFKVYPDLAEVPDGFERKGMDGEFAVYYRKKSVKDAGFAWVRETERTEEKAVFECELNIPGGCADCFVQIGYEGDRAELFINGDKEADDFYTGFGWEVGLKRFNFPKKLKIEVYPYHEGDKIYFEKLPEMIDKTACSLNKMTVSTEEVFFVRK